MLDVPHPAWRGVETAGEGVYGEGPPERQTSSSNLAFSDRTGIRERTVTAFVTAELRCRKRQVDLCGSCVYIIPKMVAVCVQAHFLSPTLR